MRQQLLLILLLATLALAGCKDSLPGEDAAGSSSGAGSSSSGSSGGSSGSSGSGSGSSSGSSSGGDSGALGQSCFWLPVGFSAATLNLLLPEESATYWLGVFPIPPQGQVVLRGDFPHARYSSFNSYDLTLGPIDSLPDIEIAPEPGSSNPFLPGADRGSSQRRYTIYLRSGEVPEQPAANTLYSHLRLGGLSLPTGPVAIVIYRVYLADQGQDRAGGSPLPEASFDADGDGVAEIAGLDACAAVGPGLQDLVLEELIASLPTVAPGLYPWVYSPLKWMRFFNFNNLLADTLGPLGAPLANYDETGGLASNGDIRYIYSIASQRQGDVVAFEARFPTTPTTYSGDPVMGSGQLRYWSLCSNDLYLQKVIDCVNDEAAVPASNAGGRNPNGQRRIVVVSPPALRPANATEDCGVNWLAWGYNQDVALIYRHMLPAADFAEAVQNIPAPDSACEAPVMQGYFPYGRVYSVAEFEQLGCPVDPDAIPDEATQLAPTENCDDEFPPATGTIHPAPF